MGAKTWTYSTRKPAQFEQGETERTLSAGHGDAELLTISRPNQLRELLRRLGSQ